MSAIRQAIQYASTEEIDAAEAELKELEGELRIFKSLEYAKLLGEARAQLAERDRRDAELREALELYKGHELKLERLVREVFRWATGEGPKAPIAPDREAQVQREVEEFYGESAPRQAGCLCHLEVGDSPCPIHGEDSE